MKKTLLALTAFLVLSTAQSQILLMENFDTFPATWTKTNQSAPAGTNLWAQATAAQTPYFLLGAYNGAVTSYAFANFNSTTGGTGIISNWLITPSVTLNNGDLITFYARKGLSGGATVYADRMEVRMSTAGAFTTDPVGSGGVGDYTTVIANINPAQNLVDFPTLWTQYNYTVTGLTDPTDCKIGFRYFVTNAGPSGAKSDQIGLDAVLIERPLATDSFFKNNYSVYPNPASDVININKVSNAAMTAAQITDINGRVVKAINSEVSQINISDLNAGVYMLKLTSAEGTGTTKIIKK